MKMKQDRSWTLTVSSLVRQSCISLHTEATPRSYGRRGSAWWDLVGKMSPSVGKQCKIVLKQTLEPARKRKEIRQNCQHPGRKKALTLSSSSTCITCSRLSKTCRAWRVSETSGFLANARVRGCDELVPICDYFFFPPLLSDLISLLFTLFLRFCRSMQQKLQGMLLCGRAELRRPVIPESLAKPGLRDTEQ